MAWFTRDVTRTLLAQGPVFAFGLAASILTARVLGPTDRGLYSLCFLIANTAVLFCSLHLGQSLAYHVGRRGLAVEKLLGAALLLVAALGGLVFAVLRLAEPPLLHFFEHLQRDAYRLIALAAPLMLANTVFTQIFRALDRIDLFNVCRLLNPAIRLAALAAAFAVGGGLLEALRAVIAAELLLCALQLALLWRQGRPNFRDGSRVAGSVARFGARLEGAAAIAQIDLSLTGFAVAYYCSAADFGFYAIADGIVGYVFHIPLLVANVLLPKIAADDDRRVAHMVAATCRSTLLLITGIAALLAAASLPIVGLLYGAEYLPAATVMAVLLPMAIGRSGVRILSTYVIVVDRLRVLAIANTIALVVHAGLLLAIVPVHGIVGAAAVTGFTYLLHMALMVVAFRRLTGLPLREILLVDRTDLERLWRAGLDAVSLRALRPDGRGR